MSFPSPSPPPYVDAFGTSHSVFSLRACPKYHFPLVLLPFASIPSSLSLFPPFLLVRFFPDRINASRIQFSQFSPPLSHLFSRVRLPRPGNPPQKPTFLRAFLPKAPPSPKVKSPLRKYPSLGFMPQLFFPGIILPLFERRTSPWGEKIPLRHGCFGPSPFYVTTGPPSD